MCIRDRLKRYTGKLLMKDFILPKIFCFLVNRQVFVRGDLILMMYSVFSLKVLIEKRRGFNVETHLAFTDYEQAFHRVNRNILWNMYKRGYLKHLIHVIRSLHYRSRLVLFIWKDLTEKIYVKLSQGCSIPPTLFNICINDIVREWKLSI